MSLLREIQNDLASAKTDVVSVLRKCKILAARLNSPELTRWVDSELNGYQDPQPTPEYRLLPAQCYANFMNIRWRATHQTVHPLAVPAEYRDTLFGPIEFRDGITIATACASEGATIDAPLLQVLIGRHRVMYPEMQCTGAWRQVSGPQFQQLIGAVKNRILDFSLKIEEENPSAGEALPNSQPVAKEKLQPLVQNIFYGSVGNIAQHSDNFTQNAKSGLEREDLSRLVTELTHHLPELHLEARDKRRAEAQIAVLRAELAGEPDSAIVNEAGRTLRSITEGAIGGLIASAAQPSVWLWVHQILQSFGAK